MFSTCLPPAIRTGLWLAIAGFGAGCTSVAPGEAAWPGHLQQLADRYGICDVAVAVVRQRALQAVETANGCTVQTGPAEDTVFEAASLSKPVFAYAVLKLVQQGKMDLDAPILRYLPHGYRHRHYIHLADSPVDLVTDPKLAAVTVRMALNHTAALPGWSGGPLAFDGIPGARWQYSGEGYVLLQRAVETVTQKDLGTYMQDEVFGPLGMTHSAWTREPRLEKHIAAGSDVYGNVMTSSPFREPVAAYSLYTSAGDYGRFLAALLQDHAALRQITAAPVTASTKLNLRWGLGWGLEQGSAGSDDIYLWHWGNNLGYRAFVMASPRTGDGFVLFTNSEKGLALAEPVAQATLPGPHPVFRFHLLRDGLANWVCEVVEVCL